MAGGKVNVIIELEKQRLESFARLEGYLERSEKKTKELKNATYALNKARNKGGSGTVAQKNRYNKALEEELAATKMVNIELKKQNLLYKKLRIAQKKANDEKKKSGALGRNLANAYFKIGAAIAVITGAFRQLTKMRDTLVMLDSFKFAMQKITGSNVEAAEAFQFVTAMSDAYGISLAKTADRYVKFSTAARQSGLTLFDTQNIYNSMSKASGVLGLKTHEVEGVFLALEQMLSKGKVTTEELRRQLGERLPGAMGMMVTAYNRLHPKQEVTMAQFDKLLKKGQVLSAEILPEFAKVVETELGINAVESVDTLIASMTRADNAYTTMIADMERGTGKLAAMFQGFYNLIAEIWEDIGELFLTTSEMGDKSFQLGFAVGRVELAQLLRDEQDINKVEDEAVRRQNVAEELGRRYQSLQRALTTLGDKPDNATVWEFLLKGGVFDAIPKILATNTWETNYKYLKEEQGKMLGAMRALNEDTKNKMPDIIPDPEDKGKKPFFLPYIDPESKKGIEQSLKYMREVFEGLAPTDPERKRIEDMIIMFEEYLKEVSNLGEYLSEEVGLDGQQVSEKVIPPVADPKAALNTFLRGSGMNPEAFDVDAMLAEFYEGASDDDSILALRKWYKKWLKKQKKEAEDHAEDMKDANEEIFQLAMQLGSELFNLGGAILENKLENIEAEIRAEEEKYDRLLELAEGDEEATKRIEEEKLASMKKLEKEELKLRQKSAKLAKAQAIFDIGANTAVAIMGIWRDFPKVDFGASAAIMTGIVAALGATQIATVLAAPIPKYASGRIGGREELAITGDAGQSEVVRRADGSVYMTPNRPTLTMLGQGDSVYSSKNAFQAQLEREILRGYNPDYDKIEDAITTGFKKAKINNTTRPVVKVIVRDDKDWLIRNSQF